MLAKLQLPHPNLPPVPPLWRESRIGLEWAALRRSDVYHGAGVPAGDGRGVLLIPGFMAGDGSLATLTHWLRAAGWHTKRAGIRANIACSEVACCRIEERLERVAEGTGARVTLIGQSRGGVFAKALAARRPDLVAGRHRARLAGALAARGPSARARAGRRRRDARGKRRAAAACCPGAASAARAASRSAPRSRARSPTRSATSRSTRARTGSSTGTRASTPTPTRSSRCADRTAA